MTSPSKFQMTVNGQRHTVEARPDTPVLWVLRDQLQLTGTKYGCGIAQCGACTILFGGHRMFACQLPVSVAARNEILTIEGLSDSADHPLQRAWIAEQVPQCGYCQSGMIMSALDLLQKNDQPTADEIASHMNNICRCGTYPRIVRAIQRAAEEMRA